MPKIDVYNMNGEKVREIELSDEIFGIEVKPHILHMAVVNQLANKRQGTQSTKTRGEVRGGGRKPWRQKGTGRARQGSIRAPQWVKGGVALGPKPRNYKYRLPKKVRRLALKSALSSKVNTQNIIVLDKLDFDQIKTKQMVNVLNNLKVDTSALIVLSDKNERVEKSARNIPNVKTALYNTINVYDIIKYEKFIITEDAVKKVEEVYA
ncbi:MAG TPA: 50S ribosomal protein L4 [Clostridiaceae bacterium]|nr:50S ribosomal protein L4 [Clostridiaceae bacterium]